MDVLIVTNVRGYSPSLQVRSSVKVKEWVWACNECAADELSLISPVHWSIYHQQRPLKILTAPRARPLFNLRSCCLKPPTDVISSLDTLFFICCTRLFPVLLCRDSLLTAFTGSACSQKHRALMDMLHVMTTFVVLFVCCVVLGIHTSCKGM